MTIENDNGNENTVDELSVPLSFVVPGERGITASWDGRCDSCGRRWLASALIYRALRADRPGWMCALCGILDRSAAYAPTGPNDPLHVAFLEAAALVALFQRGLFREPPPGPETLPTTTTTAESLAPGDLVRRMPAQRAAVVTRVESTTHKVWVRQVSGKEHGYVLEERLCRPEWLEPIDAMKPWIDSVEVGHTIELVDYGGWKRTGLVLDQDQIFILVRYRTRSGDTRIAWFDRFIAQSLRTSTEHSGR